MATQTPMICDEDKREIPSSREIKVKSQNAFEPSDDTSVSFVFYANNTFTEDTAIVVDTPTKVTTSEIKVMVEVLPSAAPSPNNTADRYVLVSQPTRELVSDQAVLMLYAGKPSSGSASSSQLSQKRKRSRK